MIGMPETDTLNQATISANINTGYQVQTKDGRPARLAIIDADGNVVDASDAVAREAWNVCITVQKNFWKGQGHLVVHSSPTGLRAKTEDAA